jgi:hypothetical protein
MSELVDRAQELESEDKIMDYASEAVNTFRAAENWNPSSHKRYGHITDGIQGILTDLAESDAQYGHQVIFSYNNLNDNTRAALNLQVPDVQNDEMLTGSLSYSVNSIVAGLRDEISRINRTAAKEAIPEDSSYLSQIPEEVDDEEIVGSDIVKISVPAFGLDTEDLSEDLESLGRTIDRLDHFYDEEIESVLKTSARDFLSDGTKSPTADGFSQDRDGWTF